MKKYMPLEGLRWSRDSGSALCDTSQNSRSRTGWGALSQGTEGLLHPGWTRDKKGGVSDEEE